MAGKNQHHVWQLLQRGFGIKHGKHYHIYFYEKNTLPRRTSTNKYGSEDFYYVDDSAGSADDPITQFESENQSEIQRLRSAAHGHEVDSRFAASLLTHLEMRSRYLREEISRMVEILTQEMDKLFSNNKTLKILLLSYIKENPKTIEERLEKEGISNELKVPVKILIDQYLPDLLDNALSKGAVSFDPLFDHLLNKMKEMAKYAHIKSLMSDFHDLGRTRIHQNLKYMVARTDGELIHPDTCVTFFKRNGVAPFYQNTDQVTDVIIPISSNAYIYGYKNERNLRDAMTLRRALAGSSYEAFIAKNDDVELRRLSTRIGKHTELLSASEIRRMVTLDSLINRAAKNKRSKE